MRRPGIELQHEDGTHYRYLARSEASDLLSTKGAERIYRRKTTRMILRLIQQPNPSESHSSPASISKSEMLAYVGLGSPFAIRKARAKVQQFNPSIHGATAQKEA